MSLREGVFRISAAFRTSAALGLQPLTAPVMVFIPLGVLLGPQVSGVLSDTALAHLDVVVSIGLATLGVFIGLALGREGTRTGRLLAASSVEACVTILVVASALLVLLRAWNVPIDMPYVSSRWRWASARPLRPQPPSIARTIRRATSRRVSPISTMCCRL